LPEHIKPHPERAALAPLIAELTAAAGADFLEAVAAEDMDELAVRPGALIELARRVRGAGFNLLLDVGGTDHHPLSPRFEVSYHFAAVPTEDGTRIHSSPLQRIQRLRLRVFPDDRTPVVPTLTGLWPSADWPEREVFDLFGVRFEGHPNLRRLLNPDDFKGHPLRKDFPLRGLERRFVPGGRVGPIPPVKS
jgi:NADH-quinone oxidoreductase subunit C